jgi:M6 family metalloprotease-like protein
MMKQILICATIVASATAYRDIKDIQPALGVYTNLVIPIRWADTTGDLPTWEDYQLLFDRVEHIYNVTSLGKFSVKSSVMNWYNSSHNSFEVGGGNFALGCCTVQQVIREAVLDQLVDSSLFDIVTFVHSGYSAEWGDVDSYGNIPENRIWSHQSNFVYPIGKWKTYVIASGLWGISGNEIARPGVFAHEILHNFGLPDVYDTYSDGNNVGTGLGCFSLMSSSWGCDDSQNPPMLDPFLRMKLGWVDPISIDTSGTYDIADSQTSGQIYKISKNYFDGEYLLIENRIAGGIESNLIGSGILVYHIDEATSSLDTQSAPSTSPGCVNSTVCQTWPWNHYKIALLQADGLYELETTNTYGNQGDFYLNGMTLGPTTLPNTNTYQNGIVRDTKLTINFGVDSFQVSWPEELVPFLPPEVPIITPPVVTPPPPPPVVTPPPPPVVTPPPPPVIPPPVVKPSNLVKQITVFYKLVNRLYNMTASVQIENPTKKTYIGQFRRVLKNKIVWSEKSTSTVIKNGVIYFNSRLRQKVKGTGYQFCFSPLGDLNSQKCFPVK